MPTYATSSLPVVALRCPTTASYIFFQHCQRLLMQWNKNKVTSASFAAVTRPSLPAIEVPLLSTPSPLVYESSWSCSQTPAPPYSLSLSSDSFCSIHSAALAPCWTSSFCHACTLLPSQAYIAVEVNRR
ncbi:hypothetical protein BHM03_00031410 [Ensete ventricosum]|nr:hypothetical protein BHM03_00031410 [Ensete ventricosum]